MVCGLKQRVTTQQQRDKPPRATVSRKYINTCSHKHTQKQTNTNTLLNQQNNTNQRHTKTNTDKNTYRHNLLYMWSLEPQLQGGQFTEKIGQHIIVTGRLATTRPSAKGDSFPHGVQAGTVPLFVYVHLMHVNNARAKHSGLTDRLRDRQANLTTGLDSEVFKPLCKLFRYKDLEKCISCTE